MARPRGIPEKYDQAILEKAAEGLSTREIAAWMLSEHRIKCSHVAVSRVVKRTRQDRAEVTKAVVRERLGKTVTSDLDRLERARARATANVLRIGRIVEDSAKTNEADPAMVNAWKGLQQLEVQILSKKLELAGAAETDAESLDVTGLSDDDLERVARGEAPVGGGAGGRGAGKAT